MISVRRLAGTSISLASARAERPSGIRYSSRRISPGCDRNRAIDASLVIVGNLYRFRPVCRPDEAHSPLPVDPNRMLTATIALECLQAVARRRAQVVQAGCRVDHIELAQCYSFNAAPLRRARSVTKQSLGRFVSKAPDHAC